MATGVLHAPRSGSGHLRRGYDCCNPTRGRAEGRWADYHPLHICLGHQLSPAVGDFRATQKYSMATWPLDTPHSQPNLSANPSQLARSKKAARTCCPACFRAVTASGLSGHLALFRARLGRAGHRVGHRGATNETGPRTPSSQACAAQAAPGTILAPSRGRAKVCLVNMRAAALLLLCWLSILSPLSLAQNLSTDGAPQHPVMMDLSGLGC